MRTAFRCRFDRAIARLHGLVDRPWSLFFALLAVNAVALPYRGLVHDSELYAVQAMNHVENGAYADDLFFCYGSQDQYSLCSIAIVPLVRVLGPEAAFFLLYLVFNALLLLGAQRLLLTLFNDRIVVALSLLLLATTSLCYTAFGCLAVNESFFTPRILAVALALFAVERALQARYILAALLLAVAGLMHPLMACGGVLACAGYWLVEHLGWRRTLLVGAMLAIAALAVLAYRPLGTRLFGPLDDEWRDYARRAVPMNFPAEWSFRDWLNIAAGLGFACGLGLASRRTAQDTRLARFALVIAAVSTVAVVGTVVAAWLPYALPVQSQPYRALWLLRLLQAPFGLQLMTNLWREPDGRARPAAVAVAACFAVLYFAPLELGVIAFSAVAVALVYYRAFSPAPRAPDWLARSVVAGVFVGAGAWVALRVCVALALASELLQVINPMQYASAVLDCVGILGWAVIGLLAVGVCERVLGLGRRFCAAAAAACLVLQAGAWIAINLWEVPARPTSDLTFVGRFLQAHRAGGGRLATVYCAVGEAADVWLTCHANSYFTRQQLSGNLFFRQTAMEGQRRARLVRRFEQQRVRCYRLIWSDAIKRNQEELFEAPLDVEPPTLDDLIAVCREDGVDYVAVPQAFDAPCVASNGHIYIYDCRAIRIAAGGRPGAAGAQFAMQQEPGD